jgi:hypothetical protein
MEIIYFTHMVASRMLQVGSQTNNSFGIRKVRSPDSPACLTPGQIRSENKTSASLDSPISVTRLAQCFYRRTLPGGPRQSLHDEKTLVAHHLADRFH